MSTPNHVSIAYVKEKFSICALLLFLIFLLRERFGYASTPIPLSNFCMKERISYVITHALVPIIPEIERIGYEITPNPVSIFLVEGEIWLCEHYCLCVYCLCER